MNLPDSSRIGRKFPLGFFPTPLHALQNLTDKYPGYKLYMKRDDHTGLATGGNKTRKLEYLVQEALDQGCDTLVTAGAQQSNHCRQAAAASVQARLECHLLLRGSKPETVNGNLLLSTLMGAHTHYCGEDIEEEDVRQVMDDLRRRGRKPYYTPIGGSTLTGSLGYVDAMKELKEQMTGQKLPIDTIFFASSSGGTQAGMLLGKAVHGIDARLMPVNIDKSGVSTHGSLEDAVLVIANEGAEAMGLSKHFTPEDVKLVDGYGDAGYGVVTEKERSIIWELASTEGIFLDPVYTARAFYAMTDMLKTGQIKPGANVLFWHTGGTTANFHYYNELSGR